MACSREEGTLGSGPVLRWRPNLLSLAAISTMILWLMYFRRVPIIRSVFEKGIDSLDWERSSSSELSCLRLFPSYDDKTRQNLLRQSYPSSDWGGEPHSRDSSLWMSWVQVASVCCSICHEPLTRQSSFLGSLIQESERRNSIPHRGTQKWTWAAWLTNFQTATERVGSCKV